jgi:putative ABC transport system permease protein
MCSQWLDDCKYGVRNLLGRPGFALAALSTLSLALGANATVFSFVSGTWLRPLPLPQPSALITIQYETRQEREHRFGRSRLSVRPSPLDLLIWRTHSETLGDVGAAQVTAFRVTDGEFAENILGLAVTPNFVSVLGADLVVGRSFYMEEAEPGNHRVALLSHQFWTRRFGGVPDVIGANLELDGEYYKIAGVLPKDLDLIYPRSQVYTPLALDSSESIDPADRRLEVVARLADSVSIIEAREELAGLTRYLRKQHPDIYDDLDIKVDSLHTQKLGRAGSLLLMLLTAVGFVLAIACFSVAALLSAQITERRRDTAIRLALGAGRGQVLRQVLIECLILAVLAGVVGLLLASWGVEVIRGLIPEFSPRIKEVTIDFPTIVFLGSLSLISSVLVGAVPALESSRMNLYSDLAEDSRVASAGRRQRRASKVFLVLQVALAVVLMIGAGLMVRTLIFLQTVHLGFDPQNLLHVRTLVPPDSFAGDNFSLLARQLAEQATAIVGVESAEIAIPPLSGLGARILVDGDLERERIEGRRTEYAIIGSKYFRLMGIPIRRGRSFDEGDVYSATGVAIVNETMAQVVWGGGNPLGRKIQIEDSNSGGWVVREIVGIAADVRFPVHIDPHPLVYLPVGDMAAGGMIHIILRIDADASQVVDGLRKRYAELLPKHVVEVTAVEDLIRQQTAEPRFFALLFSVFGFIALLVVLVGLYGVVSYSVVQRTHEIGVRRALGAQQSTIRWMISREGMFLVVMGLVFGLLGSVLLGRLVSHMIFGISSIDPTAYIGASVLVLATGYCACYLPARKAASFEPLKSIHRKVGI